MLSSMMFVPWQKREENKTQQKQKTGKKPAKYTNFAKYTNHSKDLEAYYIPNF